jgi:hypothetical protein
MTQLNVRLTEEQHAQLLYLARDDKRSLNAQVQWLIEQEAVRRGMVIISE